MGHRYAARRRRVGQFSPLLKRVQAPSASAAVDARLMPSGSDGGLNSRGAPGRPDVRREPQKEGAYRNFRSSQAQLQ